MFNEFRFSFFELHFSSLYVNSKRPYVYITHNCNLFRLQSPLQPVKNKLNYNAEWNLNRVVVWADKELLNCNPDLYGSKFGCLKRWGSGLQECLHKPEN